MTENLSSFPVTAGVNDLNHLTIGGLSAVELAAQFATPLYVFDEDTLRGQCAAFKTEFGKRYANTDVIYACKAFINTALAQIFHQEGIGLDAVSIGEIGIARAAGFPLERVYFHGNNKSVEELGQAVKWGVGRVVVDNFYELEVLNITAREQGKTVDILLRLSPAVDPHTHKYISTGIIDSKFGFPISSWEEAVLRAMDAPHLNLLGLHFHIGSQIHKVKPYELAIDKVLDFAVEMSKKHRFELKELDIGGGFAIQYTVNEPSPPIGDYAEPLTARIISRCQKLGFPLPRLVVEPGRSMIGRSGVALYEVGAIKDIPGIRRYVSVDGGMGDNIRPALYEAQYEAVAANKMNAQESGKVTISGKYCESGDILIRDIAMPELSAGDIIALPGCGAYCLPMASNYNAALRPAVVMVKDGKVRVIRRRETLSDLTRCDIA